MLNNSRDRALYEKAKGMFEGATPTISYLREEANIVNNNGVYQFTFNEQTGVTRPTERKLSIKDAFLANMIWLFTLVEAKTKPGSGVLMTYPNPVEIAKAGTSSADELEAIYNGTLKAQVDQDLIFDGIDTRRFRVVSATQLNAINDKEQQDYAAGGLLVEPNLVLNGSRKNIFTLQLPAFDSSVTPNMAATLATHNIRVVLVFGGYYIPGGAGLLKK